MKLIHIFFVTTILSFMGAALAASAEPSLDALAAKAQAGDPAAAYALGLRYWSGEGASKDAERAIIWFSRAAAKDFPSADTALGIMYEDGEGVKADPAQAAYHYRRAAEKGEAMAQYRLGLLYTEGRGVARDDKVAAHWYEAAAEKGLADAQNNLGLFYETGRGVEQSTTLALAWYEKAAAGGSEDAKANLANLRARIDASQPEARKPPTPEAIWAALAKQPLDKGALPEGFKSPQVQAMTPPKGEGEPRFMRRINLSHSAGPHWYGDYVYASSDAALAAYRNFAEHLRASLPNGLFVRPFSVSRLIGNRPFTFACAQYFPGNDTSAHDVQCAYFETGEPVLFVAGTAARYTDANYPPDAVWQRVTDLLAYADEQYRAARAASARRN